MSSILLNAAAGLAITAYADAKWGLYNDVRLARSIGKLQISHAIRQFRGKTSLWAVFEDQARSRPDAECYVFEGRVWTWRQVELEARRLANYLINKGLAPNARIAVFMGNKAAYPITFLACLAANVVPAFINNTLTGVGLAHCVRVSDAQLILYEPALESVLADVQGELAASSKVRDYVRFDDGIPDPSEKAGLSGNAVNGAELLGPAELARVSSKEIPASRRASVNDSSSAVLIFTSGTTGLPKAALCSHGRVGTGMVVFPTYNGFGPNDRIYTPMPLYHSSAALLCIGAAWFSGSTVIIGRRFSATRYWADVRENKATVVQYIGEIARYLLAVPPHPDDKNHNVRLAYGNGMRPDVWEKFRERFGVPNISEFYASSEGNGALLNYNTGPFGAGAVGRMGPLSTRARPDFRICQVDPITEEPYRDPKTGFCVECAPGESGEFLMKINTNVPHGSFQGYAGNPEATAKKILANVFEKGDAYFRSGDLLRKDEDGFFYFGDRMGDTFRWRSENVSTAEVAAALGEVIDEANVYGVLVPAHDGRAGCAAIPASAAATMDLKVLAVHARKRLPKYAVPLFLRIVPTMDQTGTVKQLKVALRNQGIDHKQVGPDPLYWLPPGSDSYRPFTPQDLKNIEAGKVRL